MPDANVLVIGSGVAGLTYALKAAEFTRVRLITKKENTESNTNYAQGGIAAVMAPDDAPELHVADTLTAGAGLCHRDAVEELVREGPERIRELIAWGARFSLEQEEAGLTPDKATGQVREAGARLSLGREGGHSRRRIVHAKDLTGREVERTLVTAVQQHPNITVLEHHIAVDLLCHDRGGVQVHGATVLDTRSAEVRTFLADAVVLATGGCGQVYLHTTNPPIATGDGVAIAYRAGARIANMEFIQFHPTTLYHPAARSFLISEAVRGEGAVLRLKNGESFMERYHPLASLAPRDVVARAIDAELKESGDDCVYLDLTHLEPATIRNRFPHIYGRCLEYGIDITREPIPIVPAAHYSCGGVLTDLEARTSIDRLYAVGEVACTGVHGANRLASNSLLEALVFAHRAAASTHRLLETRPARTERPAATGREELARRENEVSPEFPDLLKRLLQTLMWTHVGIVRSDRRLHQALREVQILNDAAESLFGSSRVTEGTLELRNLARVALLIIRSALLRKESRGLHYNLDYPNRDDERFLHDTVVEKGPE
jgi:L-aspartate oxidase